MDKATLPKQGTLSCQLLTREIALKPKRSKDVFSYHQPSELLQLQKETQMKEQLSRLHGVENLNGLTACVTDHQTVLTGLVQQPLFYHVKQLLLETAGILSRKTAECSEKRSAKYHP